MHGRNIVFAYLGVALPALIALLLYPNLIQNLGVDRFGALSLLLSIAVFFGYFDFGVGLAITRYVARCDGRNGSRGAIRRLVRHALWLQSGVGLSISIVLVGVHQIWGLLRVDSSVGVLEEFEYGVLWLAASIPLALLAGVVRCGFEGIGRFGISNALRAPASISVFAAPIGASFFTSRIDDLALVLLLTRIAAIFVFFIVWSRVAPPEAYRKFCIRSFSRHAQVLLSYGGWVMVGGAAGGAIALGVLDRVLIARFVDVAGVLQYTIPSDVIVRGLVIPSAIATVVLTVLTRTIVADASRLPNVHTQAVRIMAGQVGPIVVLLVLHAEWVLGMLTRLPVPESSVLILQGMATGYFIHALGNVPYCGLQAAGAPRAASLRHLVQLPVYALGSIAVLTAGHIGSIGWFWCLWAIVDLLMLLLLLRRIAPQQHGPSAFLSPQVWAWVVLIGLALGTATWPLDGAVANLALSMLAATLFLWQLGRIVMTRTLFTPLGL